MQLNSIVVNWINNDTVHGINASNAWIVFIGSHDQAVSCLCPATSVQPLDYMHPRLRGPDFTVQMSPQL